MKWICDQCMKKQKENTPCVISVSDCADPPMWCPWALDPFCEDAYAEWEEIKDTPTVTITPDEYDPVNRPSHYTEGRKYEPIDVIEDWELGFCTGNALKYISRAGRKDNAIQDLEKAKWYIERKIQRLKVKE